MHVRPAAVAGTWYPESAHTLTEEIESYLARADLERQPEPSPEAELLALIAPHAGILYSGPVAAHAYRLLRSRPYDVVIIVGPSHYVGFSGASIWPRGSFDTPLGLMRIDEELASAMLARCPEIRDRPDAHRREHSVEMQLPFLGVIAPGVKIVPIVMGHQTRETVFAVGDCIGHASAGRRALLVASSDLSHFFNAATAAALDHEVAADVSALDDEALMARLEERRDHACGGGPIVAVMRAAKVRGATASRVLTYADSGDVSGDKSSVVGYLAAAMWR
jgi:AmmeMemoRadiSam system protein B